MSLFNFLIYSTSSSSYLRLNIPYSIGSTLDENQFENSLTKIFPTPSKNIAIILVPSFQWSDVLALASTLACNIQIKLPSVHAGYTIAKEYLDANKFKTSIIQKDDLESGLKEYCETQSFDGVMLTSLDSGVVVSSRNRRQVYNNLLTNETDTYIYGPTCVTMFNSIYFVNNTNPSTTTRLTLDSDASAFTCNVTKNETT